jgi:hypothetical protein
MKLSETVSIARRFQRSVRLDHDIDRLEALHGYICQNSAAEALRVMARQIADTSHRAFTWTGPFGGGKSSLAVILAALLGPQGPMRKAAGGALGPQTAEALISALKLAREGWLVVPVVGRRSDPVKDIEESFERALRRMGKKRKRPPGSSTGRQLIDRLAEEAASRPRNGVLIVIDEMGKFLEHAAAEGGDIFFFQELAEIAARTSGRLIVIGILHQAFEQYARRLGSAARDEWAKIQGRFVDIPLIAGVDEIVSLLSRAIVLDNNESRGRTSADAVAASISTRRPGSPKHLGALLHTCWPLHPVTACILGPMSRRRFGQNERSVFGFLTSSEPGGFQEFLKATSSDSQEMFGPELFWEYLRVNLEPAILSSNDSHRWAQGIDAVERCEARGGPLHVRFAKSIALIDMFRNGSGLSADRATLGTCASGVPAHTVDKILADLEQWSVAVFRKHTNSWAVYAGSDFDIESAVVAAAAWATGLNLRRLAQLAGMQPVLAKRHYHATGSLRWFQTELVELEHIAQAVEHVGDAAGHFLLALPGSDENHRTALAACSVASANSGSQLVAIGLPRNSKRIRELGTELEALEAVRVGRPELDGDSVARREIAARIAAVSADLEEELRAGFADADWHVEGRTTRVPPGAGLSRLASDLADSRYRQAPHIHSELVNRHRPSSNTQAAVRDLMHAMVARPDRQDLGITGYPAELGLYKTVLAPAGLHRDLGNGRYGFSPPNRSKIGRTFLAAWSAAECLLRKSKVPVPLSDIYRVWEAPPYGIRRGIMPLLAFAFVMANAEGVAVYSEGRFQAAIDDYFVDTLLQDESRVALRRVDIDEFRGTILTEVAAAIEVVSGSQCLPQSLEVARRLVAFVRELPAWTRRTNSLSPHAAEVRRVLLLADDPHKALFVDLPAIFGERDATAAARETSSALRELSEAYPAMLVDLSRRMLGALGHRDPLPTEQLRERARIVCDLTGELRVDAFSRRLADYSGALEDTEVIAGLALNRPPQDWSDRDPDQAALALAEFALKFRRAEVLARVKGREPTREALAFVIGTGEMGKEICEEFVVDKEDRPRITALARLLDKVLIKSGAEKSIVLAALAETGMRAVESGDDQRLER